MHDRSDLSNQWHCSREELQTPDALAVDAAFWFCERFNWPGVTKEFLANVQIKMLNGM